jgi:hypothetical protein
LKALVFACLLLAGCGAGKSTLDLTVGAKGRVDAIDHLRIFVVTSAGEKSKEADFHIGAAIPPSVTVPLRLPSSVSGRTTIYVDAMAASGTTPLASATGNVTVSPSDSAALTITLDGGGIVADMSVGDSAGATASDMATSCSPACANPVPICDNASATCHACTTSSECASQRAGMPACVSGQCLQCATNADCVAARMTCNVNDNMCEPCSVNADCTSKLCESGSCVDPTTVIFVDLNGPSCPTGAGSGTLADPFCKVQAGMDAGAKGGRRVLVATGTYSENLTAQPNGGPYVATLLGFGSAVLSPNVAGPVVRVLSDSTNMVELSMDGFTIQNAHTSDADGVECVGVPGSPLLTKVTITNGTFQNNSSADVSAQSCVVAVSKCAFNCSGEQGVLLTDSIGTLSFNTIKGASNGITSTISSTSGSGNLVADGNVVLGSTGEGMFVYTAFTITNNIVADTVHTGVHLLYFPGTFSFNTIVNNGTIGNTEPWGILCDGSNTLPQTIDSSIVWGNGYGSQTSGGTTMMTQFDGLCTLTNVVTGTDNYANAIKKTPVFVASGSSTPHDYHLKLNDPANVGASGCCVDKIAPAAGLPNHDVDNDTRPLGAGLDIGADEAQ